MKQTKLAYAKINLFLDIRSRREDGYHLIRSIMHAVSLHDEVSLTPRKQEAGEPRIRLTCSNPAVPCDGTNLACRAAEAFFAAVGDTDTALDIHIQKNIPMAAGLAGGSTDAAAVLKGLNDWAKAPWPNVWAGPLSVNELCRVGLKLGADVPFCIRGGASLVGGVGEILEPCSALPHCYVVVACDGAGVSTPAAYRALDETYGNFAPGAYAAHEEKLSCLMQAMRENDLGGVGEHAFNLFESVILPHHNEARGLKEYFTEQGATLSMMSGSGPSVFGLFADREAAQRACDGLVARGVAAHLCEPM